MEGGRDTHVDHYTGRTDDFFGATVSIVGDIAIVGSPRDVEKGKGQAQPTSFTATRGAQARGASVSN